MSLAFGGPSARTGAGTPGTLGTRRLFTRPSALLKLALGLAAFFLIKIVFYDASTSTAPGEIAQSALLERLPLVRSNHLDARKHAFLQSRTGRDERPDLFIGDIKAGVSDFWQRFQMPFATDASTMHLDEQVIKGVVEELMSFNGWAAADCSSLIRPFSTKRSRDDDFSDLTSNGQLYYFGLVVHSADHFLIDQLAVIVQLSKRLGTTNVFVSILDYASTDSTPFLCDMTEMVLVLLGIPFRIRHVPPLTADPAAVYYPSEEAYQRNLVLEPLHELRSRRGLEFERVIWLKGFACPMDIMETLRISVINKAAMTCSMDWKEHNGFFIYNDRWRTRDLDGNLFRGSKSTSGIEDAPPREETASGRYAQHVPFQVFCCESGMHIVDPHQSYYAGLSYRSSLDFGVFNLSDVSQNTNEPLWTEGPCMDSTQTHFCRDLWMLSATKTVRNVAQQAKEAQKRGQSRGLSDAWEAIVNASEASSVQAGWNGESLDVDSAEEAATNPSGGVTESSNKAAVHAADEAAAVMPSDATMATDDLVETDLAQLTEAVDAAQDVNAVARLRQRNILSRRQNTTFVPNAEFEPARIIINPRCVTTYAGVSHTQLAIDLFGQGDNVEPEEEEGGKYAIDDWRPAPEIFVCQEMRTTGGRMAPKQQRRTGFFISRALQQGWHPIRW